MNEQLPYFRIYAAELLADEHTGYFDVHELGSWFRLVCQCWVDGSIPADPKRVARLLRMTFDDRFQEIWGVIQERFEAHPTEEGRLISRRLERERGEAIEAREQKVRAGQAGGRARGKQRSSGDEAAPKQRFGSAQAERKPILPSIHPALASSSLPNLTSQPANHAREKANGAEPPESPARLNVGRLAGFKEKLGKALRLPDGVVKVGRPEAETLAFFEGQLETVGEVTLLQDCIEAAQKSTTGQPASLAWFVPWLKNLPVPHQPGSTF